MSGTATRETEAEVERQLEVMRSGAVEFYGEDELRARLGEALVEGRPLRVKLGMDPSSPDLHLGHTVVLEKLRRFQELGHTPIFLVGDFTARIGDPSGKKKTRPALDEDQVKANASTYVEQAAKILDVERAETRFNSEWMLSMSPADWIGLCSRYTVARLLERDDFSRRYAAGEPISVHEFLYPFVQAYDSVALRSDVELGGTDQTFNLLMAREVQRDYGQPPQAVLTHPLLVGTDGREKMSKSLGNSVGITDPPEDCFGKVMSISDELMGDWARQLSFGQWDELEAKTRAFSDGQGDPMSLKQELAARVVERLHGAAAASEARAHFRKVVQGKGLPDEIPEFELEAGPDGRLGLLDGLQRLELTASRGEARRLVTQGAVSLDGEKVADATLYLEPGSYLIRVGKRRYARLQLRA
ncbi:MAG: tyrosine--tRNA ligase [Myxococcota bacterium]